MEYLNPTTIGIISKYTRPMMEDTKTFQPYLNSTLNLLYEILQTMCIFVINTRTTVLISVFDICCATNAQGPTPQYAKVIPMIAEMIVEMRVAIKKPLNLKLEEILAAQIDLTAMMGRESPMIRITDIRIG